MARYAANLLLLAAVLLVAVSVVDRALGGTLQNDKDQLHSLYTYWKLGTVAGWSDPSVLDPCDNVSSFPTITCESSDPLNKQVTEMYGTLHYNRQHHGTNQQALQRPVGKATRWHTAKHSIQLPCTTCNIVCCCSTGQWF
jgi:hypothetical protein